MLFRSIFLTSAPVTTSPPAISIVDYPAVCQVLVAKIEMAGGEVVTGAEVRKIARTPEGWRMTRRVETKCFQKVM